MVAVMIAVLLAQALSGLFANDGVHFHGPLALTVPSELSDRITGIHGLIFNMILALVWIHVAAVGFYLLVRRHNLVLPMFTGRKPRRQVPDGVELVFTRLSLALLLFFVSAAIAAWIMIQGGSLP